MKRGFYCLIDNFDIYRSTNHKGKSQRAVKGYNEVTKQVYLQCNHWPPLSCNGKHHYAEDPRTEK